MGFLRSALPLKLRRDRSRLSSDAGAVSEESESVRSGAISSDWLEVCGTDTGGLNRNLQNRWPYRDLLDLVLESELRLDSCLWAGVEVIVYVTAVQRS